MERREFLKTGSLLGAATTLQASKVDSVLDTVYDQETALTGNRFGLFEVHKVSGQIVNVTPAEGDKFPNPLIQSLPDLIQNESRVLYPMVRRSYLKAKGPAANSRRGKEEFVRVSWEVALDLAAKAIKETHDKYGPESIYGECYWWGGSGKVSWGRVVSRRMLSVLGGFVEETADYSTGAGLVIMPYVLGSSSVYDTPTTWEAIAKGAKNIVFWGCDPVTTNQIAVGIPTHDSYLAKQEMKKLIESGEISAYSIDLKKNDTQRFLNSEFISIVPNTDTAMMIAMCYHLYEKELYDAEFIRKYTVGFNRFKDYLIGKSDGVKKSPEWAEPICGIKAQDIRDLAEKFAKEPTIILAGRALQRQDHGEQSFWMIVTLSAMLGHIGKEGCGFEFSLAYGATGVASKVAPVIRGISTEVGSEAIDAKYPNGPWIKGKNIVIPTSRSIEALQNPGKTMRYNGREIKLPRMRVFYLASGSPMTRHQDVNNTIKQWEKIETVITADPYWGPHTKFADIVFPVALEPERIDIDQTGPTREYIVARKEIVPPAGESKSDFWICREICKRWGYEEVFTEGKDELGWAKSIYEDARTRAEGMDTGVKMPPFEEFWETGVVRFTKDDEKTRFYTRLADFREDPLKNRLGTPSGKIEIFSPTIDKYKYDDCMGHPSWMEPIEWLGNRAKTKMYPFHLISPHSRYRLHSQLNNSLVRGYTEVSAREPMIIHPKDAESLNLKTGDIARVFNDRGEILVGVLVSDSVRERVIIINEGAWYDPVEPGKKSLCNHGNVNVLTIDKGASKLSQSNIAHTALVQIEKYKGMIRPIQAFSKPAIVQSI